MGRIWQASYARGLRLSKAGCELPYLNALPGKREYYQRAICVRQIEGVKSCAINFGKFVGYVIALRIATELTRGATISSYELVPEWEDDEIEWGLDLCDLLSKSGVDRYGKLIDSNLHKIFNERKSLSRGHVVEGLFCGRGFTPIPDEFPRDRRAKAHISITVDSGATTWAPLRLALEQSDHGSFVNQCLARGKWYRDLYAYDEEPPDDTL